MGGDCWVVYPSTGEGMVMKTVRIFLLIFWMYALLVTAGCGGGSKASNPAATTQEQGIVQLTTDWTTPEDRSNQNMYALIRVSLWQEGRLYRELELKPPTRGFVSYAELRGLPSGPLRLEAVAITSLTAPGAISTSITVNFAVQPEQITNISLAFNPKMVGH